jgi:hypothetical protein
MDLTLTVKHKLSRKTRRFIRDLLKPLFVVTIGRTIHFINLGDTTTMYTLARDHADEPYSLGAISVADSEGPVDFTEEFVSSDESVVQIIPADAQSGVIHFGTNGVADLRRNAKVGDLIVFSEAVNFTVTPGTVSASGGGISLPGLTEDAPPPAPEG